MGNLAIIPARGGSKRIPKKNIKDFFGKPIIAYSIEAALKSGLFEEVMVSTDDDEIAEVALKYGAKVPFLRSDQTADDHATLADVVFEVIEKYEFEYRYVPNTVSIILSTAPFIQGDMLKSAFKIFQNSKVDSLLSVSEFPSSVYRSFHLNTHEKIEFNFPEYLSIRSQDLPKAYFDAGQFYFIRLNSFKQYKKLSGGINYLFKLSKTMVQDIDSMEDWKEAEKKFKLLKIE